MRRKRVFVGPASPDAPASAPQPATQQLNGGPVGDGKPEVQVQPKTPSWHVFLQTATHIDIKQRFAREILDILKKNGMEKYCTLALLEPQDSIDAYDLDKVFSALSELNGRRDKDVMLLLLSSGGKIEPAYQISKLCRSFASKRFLAVVPRQAKSAATLIAIGADEIHMGPLAQLGPIDP